MASSYESASKQLKMLQQFQQLFSSSKTTAVSTKTNEVIINKQSLATSSIRPPSQTNTEMPSSSSLRSNDLIKIMEVQRHVATFRMDPANQRNGDEDVSFYCKDCSIIAYPADRKASKSSKCERKDISDEQLKVRAFSQSVLELSVSSTIICILTIQISSQILFNTLNIGTLS